MKNLQKGNEPNLMELLIENIEIKPFARVNNGMIEDGIIIKFGRYNLENILCQMLDDYGEDELIKRIKAID